MSKYLSQQRGVYGRHRHLPLMRRLERRTHMTRITAPIIRIPIPIAPPSNTQYTTGRYTTEYSNQSHFAQVLAQTIKQQRS